MGAREEAGAGKSPEAPRPTMLFALPNAPVVMETGGEPSRTAKGERQQNEGRTEKDAPPAAQPTRADAKTVADRVYDLMREEIRLSKLRGEC